MSAASKLQKIEKFRQYMLRETEGLTIEQVNTIPAGFGNNIAWNLGHVMASALMLFYKRAGHSVPVDEQYIQPFLPGTKPEENYSAERIATIRALAGRTLQTMLQDLDRLDFSSYTKSENIERVYGIALLTIEDALDFLLYHEGYHLGKIRTIKQLIETK